jgi:hypothetical protein
MARILRAARIELGIKYAEEARFNDCSSMLTPYSPFCRRYKKTMTLTADMTT